MGEFFDMLTLDELIYEAAAEQRRAKSCLMLFRRTARMIYAHSVHRCVQMYEAMIDEISRRCGRAGRSHV